MAIQPGHTLVTTGIYSKIRNPSYLGLIISMVGWGLVFRSWIGVTLGLLIALPQIGRMNAEEKLLRSHFGSEYQIYYSRTKRLIPWVY